MTKQILIGIFGGIIYLGIISSFGILIKLYQLWKEGKFNRS